MRKFPANTIAGCLVLTCVFLGCSTEDTPSTPLATEDYAQTFGDIVVFVSEEGYNVMHAELFGVDGKELGVVEFFREDRSIAWQLSGGKTGDAQLGSEIEYEWFGKAAVTLWHMQDREELYQAPPDITDGNCGCTDYCCECFRGFCLTHCAPCA